MGHCRNLHCFIFQQILDERSKVFPILCERSNCSHDKIVLNSQQSCGGKINAYCGMYVHLPELGR